MTRGTRIQTRRSQTEVKTGRFQTKKATRANQAETATERSQPQVNQRAGWARSRLHVRMPTIPIPPLPTISRSILAATGTTHRATGLARQTRVSSSCRLKTTSTRRDDVRVPQRVRVARGCRDCCSIDIGRSRDRGGATARFARGQGGRFDQTRHRLHRVQVQRLGHRRERQFPQ